MPPPRVVAQPLPPPILGVERRVREDEVGPQIRVQIALERVALVRPEIPVEAVQDEVHPREPPRRAVRLLADEPELRSGFVGGAQRGALHEHPAGAAARVVEHARRRLEHRGEQLDHATRRVELATSMPLGPRETLEEVLVDPAERVRRVLVVERDAVDHVDELEQAAAPLDGQTRKTSEERPGERGVCPLEHVHRVVERAPRRRREALDPEPPPGRLARDPRSSSRAARRCGGRSRRGRRVCTPPRPCPGGVCPRRRRAWSRTSRRASAEGGLGSCGSAKARGRYRFVRGLCVSHHRSIVELRRGPRRGRAEVRHHALEVAHHRAELARAGGAPLRHLAVDRDELGDPRARDVAAAREIEVAPRRARRRRSCGRSTRSCATREHRAAPGCGRPRGARTRPGGSCRRGRRADRRARSRTATTGDRGGSGCARRRAPFSTYAAKRIASTIVSS